MVISEYKFMKFGRSYRLFIEGDYIVLQELSDKTLTVKQWEFHTGESVFKLMSDIGMIVFRGIPGGTSGDNLSRMVTHDDMRQLVDMVSRLTGITQ